MCIRDRVLVWWPESAVVAIGVSRLAIGLHVGRDLLLDLTRSRVLVGSWYFQQSRVDPGWTAERSEIVSNVGDLRIDAVATRTRGSQLALGVIPDPLSYTHLRAHETV